VRTLPPAALQPHVDKLLAALPGAAVAFRTTDDQRISFIHATPGTVDLFGLPPELMMASPQPAERFMPPEVVEELHSALALGGREGSSRRYGFRLHHPERGTVSVEASLRPELHDDGEAIWYGFFAEVTEQKKHRKSFQQKDHAFVALAESFGDIVVRYDSDCRRVYANAAYAQAAGLPLALLLGQRPTDYSPIEDPLGFEKLLCEVLADGTPRELESRWFSIDGRILRTLVRLVPEHDAAGRVVGVIGVTRDLSQQKTYEAALDRLAWRDPLTGLPNRHGLERYLAQAIQPSEDGEASVGMLLIDLDRFKDVNDIHGYAVGDRLLSLFSTRLRDLAGDGGLLVRIGSDEFALVQKQCHCARCLSALAERVIGVLAQPFVIDGVELVSTVCIGIANYPDQARDIASLLQYADTALHEAKRAGRGQYRFYQNELTARARERLGLERALRMAVSNNELVLFYQPKVDLETTRMHSVEALLRWQHPKLGHLPPDRFIRLAEETGLIVEVGQWVLREACQAACHLNEAGGPPVRVAVNLSPRQFREGNLVEVIHRILKDTGCDPSWLELEVTESLLLEDDNAVLTAFCELRKLGITLAIDDFGTGYSALAYLKRFPINVLKIDRSFICDVTTDPDSAELVKAIIAMARSLRLEVVAEGVEREAEEAFLKQHGCDLAQGFRYGKPMPILDSSWKKR
jgi:diguanylate cyclase (GGDEF)-like protein/PAS domain S-box-containing protein